MLFFMEMVMFLWVKQAVAELGLIDRSLEPTIFDFVREVLLLVRIL
jgi:hypothetical protein